MEQVNLSPAVPSTSPDSRKRHRLMALTLIVYISVSFIYAAYGTYTMTGLPGHIVEWQMALMGWASVKLSFMLTFIVSFAPFAVLFTLFNKMAPAETRAFITYANPRNTRFPSPMPWSYVLAIPAVVAILGGTLSTIFYAAHKQDEKLPVNHVSLQNAPIGPDFSQGFIALTGTVARQYIVMYKSHGTLEVFAPVVESGWTSAAPVRYLVHFQTSVPDTGTPNLPVAFSDDTLDLITGKLSHNIPGPVSQKLASLHLKTPDGVAVVEWQDLPGQSTYPVYDDVLITIIITVLISGMALLMLSFAKWQNARVQRVRG